MINVHYFELMLQYFTTFLLVSNMGNKFTIKLAAKQINDSVFCLEMAFEGYSSDTFCEEVLSIVLGDSTEDLVEKVIPQFSNYGISLYMTHYLRKLMGLKHKLFNVVTASANNLPCMSSIKTPNQYSRLPQFVTSGRKDLAAEMNAKDSGYDFTVKLMLLLDKNDLISGDIDKTYEKYCQTTPEVVLLTNEKARSLEDQRIADWIVNRRTMDRVKQELAKLIESRKSGVICKELTMDWLSTQSYAEDFTSLAIKHSEDNTFDPLDEDILTDQNLGAIESELFAWNLTLSGKITAIEREHVNYDIFPNLVNSELVSKNQSKGTKYNVTRTESKSDDLIPVNQESHVTSVENSELADKITDLGIRKLNLLDVLQVKSCEPNVSPN
jgi:hypothetical protein